MLAPPNAATFPPARKRRGFTLVEMLVVMGVIVVLIGLVTPALTSLKGAGDVTQAVYNIAGVLEQSRAYAMSNNTYVYAGFNEADATTSESARQSSGTGKVGRVALVVIAAKDGTSNFAANNLAVVGKVQTFPNLHLVNLGTRPTTGKMVRPPLGNTTAVASSYNVGDPACVSATPFEYPLGTAVGAGKYTFSKVIQYDPQGVARIQQNATDDLIVSEIEIGLQQTRGNVAPTLTSPVTTGNVAALQVDGITGSSHIYRP